MKPCAHCGTMFEPKRRYMSQITVFCSQACRLKGYISNLHPLATRKASIARTQVAERRAPESRQCPACGAWFTPKPKRRQQKFCSHPCAIKASNFNGNRNKFKGEVRR